MNRLKDILIVILIPQNEEEILLFIQILKI